MEPDLIRPATDEPADLAAVKALLDYGVANGKVLPRTDDELRDLIAEGHLYVFERDRQVAGVVALEVYSQRLAEVRSLVVASDRQGEGIGTALVRRCLEEAERLGVREVLAVTDRISFFHGLGFRRTLDGQEPLFIKLPAR